MTESHLKPAIKDMKKLFQKYHLNYDQIHYITKIARNELDINREKNKRQTIERLRKDEQQKLIESAYKKEGYMGLLIKTLLFTGVRVSEFVEIKVEDFFFEEQIIIIKKAKGDKQRIVPITKELTQELKTYIDSRNTGHLFESKRNAKYSSRRIQQIVKGIALDAGIKKNVHPHLLRHTVATFLLEHGMPIEQIQIFLGHERLENTRIYAKNSSSQIKDEYNKAMKQF